MKLLIVTQAVDKNHSVLGFFIGWIKEFSKHCEKITVICLQKGEFDLPGVEVLSLGKEVGGNKFSYLINFYKYIWNRRDDYDAVFVHMNQIYVILGGILWKLLGKKIGLWYAHGKVSLSLRLAVLMADNIFTSTKHGMRVRTKKIRIVGQGIDTEKFKTVTRKNNKTLELVTVGRISKSKNIDTLLKACDELQRKEIDFKFRIVGEPITQDDIDNSNNLRGSVTSMGLTDKVEWLGAIPNSNLPKVLQESDIFIHDGATNSLDKVLLEAVLCGCIVISSNPAYKSVVKSFTPMFIFSPGNHQDLTSSLLRIISQPLHTSLKPMEKVREYVNSNYTVSNLISDIVNEYE